MPKTSFTKQQVKRFREIEKIQQGRGEEGLSKLFDALIERLEREYNIEPRAAVPRKNLLDRMAIKINVRAREKNITQDPYFGDKLIYLSLLVPSYVFLLWSVWFLLVGDVPVVRTIAMSRTWEVALPFAISRWWDIPAAMIIAPTLFLLYQTTNELGNEKRSFLWIVFCFFVISLICMKMLGIIVCLCLCGGAAVFFGGTIAFTNNLGQALVAFMVTFLITVSFTALVFGVVYPLALGVVIFFITMILAIIIINIAFTNQ